MPKPRGNWKVRECADVVEPFLTEVYNCRSGKEKDTQLQDLLTDLMHFAYRYRLDFDRALSGAQIHAETEQVPTFSEGRA